MNSLAGWLHLVDAWLLRVPRENEVEMSGENRGIIPADSRRDRDPRNSIADRAKRRCHDRRLSLFLSLSVFAA